MDSKSLIDKILEASKEIARHSRRGSSNYIVMSASASEIIQGILQKAQRRKDKINKILNEK